MLHNILACTVTSPNIARPLTLRTSPSSDYATFNKIQSFLLFHIGLLLEREKQEKVFILCRGGFRQKIGKCCLKLSDRNFKWHRLQIIYFQSSY